jgi:hypothetical protein
MKLTAHRVICIGLCGLLLSAASASTQNIPATNDPPKKASQVDKAAAAESVKDATAKETDTSPPATSTLKNQFGFGLALGLSAKVAGPNIVNNATIDANGMVRVNTRANTSAGVILETHYLLWPTQRSHCLSGPATSLPDSCAGKYRKEDDRWWGTGPFVAAQPGSSQIISAVGAGWLVNFRRPKGQTPSGFGHGVGYEAIPAAQVLGSEFVDGQPAPKGPNGQPLPIRYETQDKGSLLVILSVTY